eukprot:gene4103-7391_t
MEQNFLFVKKAGDLKHPSPKIEETIKSLSIFSYLPNNFNTEESEYGCFNFWLKLTSSLFSKNNLEGTLKYKISKYRKVNAIIEFEHENNNLTLEEKINEKIKKMMEKLETPLKITNEVIYMLNKIQLDSIPQLKINSKNFKMNSSLYSEYGDGSKLSVFFDNFMIHPNYTWKEYNHHCKRNLFNIKENERHFKLLSEDFMFLQYEHYLIFFDLEDHFMYYDSSKNEWTLKILEQSFSSLEIDQRERKDFKYGIHCQNGVSKLVIYFNGKVLSLRNGYENLIPLTDDPNLILSLGKTNIPPSLVDYSLDWISKSESVIFGGSEGISLSNTIYTSKNYDNFRIRKVIGEEIIPRRGHSSIFHEGYLYIFGGVSFNNEVLNDLYILDFDKNTVSSKRILIRGPSPKIVYGTKFHYYFHESLVIYGGFNGEEYTNDFYSFDLKNERWRKVEVSNPLEEKYENSYSVSNRGHFILFNSNFANKKNSDHFNYHALNHSIIDFESDSTRNFHHNYVKWFRKQKPEDSDVVFHLDVDKKVYAHKFIIKNTCPKLYSQIEECEEVDQQTHVFMKFTEKVSLKVFGTFIESLYNFGLELNTKAWTEKYFDQLYFISNFYEHELLVNLLERKLSFKDIKQNYLPIKLSINLYSFLSQDDLKPVNGIVVLLLSDGSLIAHKGLLEVRSIHFKNVFSMNGFKESLTSTVEIEEVSVEIMLQILEYFYLGKLPLITPKNVIPLYFASSLFLIDEFKPLLRAVIRESLEENNVKDVIYIADIFNDEFMMNICASYLANNYDELEIDIDELPFSVKFLTHQRLKKMKK